MRTIPPPVIVFVRPQAPGNLGAIARVMSNFGCEDFRYTGGFPELNPNMNQGFSTMDWAMARKGEAILKSARACANLEDALSDVHLAIGSSGREHEFDRGYARPHVSPTAAFRTARAWAEKAAADGAGFRWSFVLGAEDDGLNQQESALCQKLVRLPTVDQAPSMNVAMALGCFLYHWNLVNTGVAPLPETDEPDAGPFLTESSKTRDTVTGRMEWATGFHKERLLDYVMGTLAHTQYLKHPDVEAVRARVRRWVQALPIPVGELLAGFEMLYQIRAWGTGKFEPRNFLSVPAASPDKNQKPE